MAGAATEVDKMAALATAANEARGLAMDSIAAAHSGHMGLPLGCAEIGATLYGSQVSDLVFSCYSPCLLNYGVCMTEKLRFSFIATDDLQPQGSYLDEPRSIHPFRRTWIHVPLLLAQPSWFRPLH